MKYILSVVCTLLSVLTSFAQGVDFIEGKTLAEVLSVAKTQNKLVFVDCFTDWCGPCKMMANQEFPKKEAGDFFNPKFVCTKIDMEKGEGPELRKKYDVNAYPTFLILDADGSMVGRCVGGSTLDKFIPLVEKSLDADKSMSSFQRKFAAGNRDKEFLLEYMDLLDKNYMRKDIKTVALSLLDGMSADEIIADKKFYDVITMAELTPANDAYLKVYDKRDEVKAKYGDAAVSTLDQGWQRYGMSFIDYESSTQTYNGFNMDGYNRFVSMMEEHKVPGANAKAKSVIRNNAYYSKDYATLYNFFKDDVKTLGANEPTSDSGFYNPMLLMAQGYKDKKAVKTIVAFANRRIKELGKKDTSSERTFTYEGKEYTNTSYIISKYQEVVDAANAK